MVQNNTIKDMLEQYVAAKTEMQLINVELRGCPIVTDSVKGSMVDHPYVLHNITVEGIDVTARDLLEARRAKLARLRLEVERFLAGVDDPHMAALLRLRYVNGLKWEQVAVKAGGGNAESTVKNAVHKFLNSKKVATKATK